MLRLAALIAASTLLGAAASVAGAGMVLFLLFEPRGLDRIWQRMKDYIRFWPFRY